MNNIDSSGAAGIAGLSRSCHDLVLDPSTRGMMLLGGRTKPLAIPSPMPTQGSNGTMMRALAAEDGYADDGSVNTVDLSGIPGRVAPSAAPSALPSASASASPSSPPPAGVCPVVDGLTCAGQGTCQDDGTCSVRLMALPPPTVSCCTALFRGVVFTVEGMAMVVCSRVLLYLALDSLLLQCKSGFAGSACTEALCANGKFDSSFEADLDCGEQCNTACGMGFKCASKADCGSHKDIICSKGLAVCTNGTALVVGKEFVSKAVTITGASKATFTPEMMNSFRQSVAATVGSWMDPADVIITEIGDDKDGGGLRIGFRIAPPVTSSSEAPILAADIKAKLDSSDLASGLGSALGATVVPSGGAGDVTVSPTEAEGVEKSGGGSSSADDNNMVIIVICGIAAVLVVVGVGIFVYVSNLCKRAIRCAMSA